MEFLYPLNGSAARLEEKDPSTKLKPNCRARRNIRGRNQNVSVLASVVARDTPGLATWSDPRTRKFDTFARRTRNCKLRLSRNTLCTFQNSPFPALARGRLHEGWHQGIQWSYRKRLAPAG